MSRPITLDGNPNLDDALRAAKALGCTVQLKRANGEVEVRHPSWQKILAVNSRRKSTPRTLLVHLRHLLHPKEVAC